MTQETLAGRGDPVVTGSAAAANAALESAAPAENAEFQDDPQAAPTANEGEIEAAGANPADFIDDPQVDLSGSIPAAGAATDSDALIAALAGYNMDVEGMTGQQFLDDVHGVFEQNEQYRQQIAALEARLTASAGSRPGAASGGSPDSGAALSNPSVGAVGAAAESAAALPAWNRPTFDRHLLRFLERDPETQQIRVVPGGDPAILRQYHEYQTWREDFMDRLEANPGEFIRPFVEAITGPLIAKHVAGARQEISAQTQAERDQHELDTLMYQGGYLALNNDGSVKRHPVNGRIVQTPEGTAFLREFQSLIQESNGSLSRSRAMAIAARLHPGKPRGSAPTRPAPANHSAPPAPGYSPSAPAAAPERRTIGDRMRGATRTPNAARNRIADRSDEDRVPSMAEIQQQTLARK